MQGSTEIKGIIITLPSAILGRHCAAYESEEHRHAVAVFSAVLYIAICLSSQSEI